MNDIAPIGPASVASTTGLGRNPASSPPTPSSSTSRSSDSVELSSTAQLLSRLTQMPAIRQDLVSSVQSQIADGTYETDDKIDTAITNLASDIQG